MRAIQQQPWELSVRFSSLRLAFRRTALSLSLASLKVPDMSLGRQAVGTLGEQAAAAALEDQGYRILNRNYRVRGGELDIVAEKNGVLVFCEVKTRTSAYFGLPEEAVTIAKRRRLRRLALEYLQREGRRARILRFDVISVALADGRVGELRHLVNAF
jgi:putative endonuclease